MWLDGYHHMRPSCLEPEDVCQALTLAVERRHSKFMSFLNLVSLRLLFRFLIDTLAQEIALRPQMPRLLQVENWGLGEEEIFPDVLPVVPVLHLFLIDVIDELLYFILVIPTSACREPLACLRLRNVLAIGQVLLSEKALLQNWRQLWDLEIFAIF